MTETLKMIEELSAGKCRAEMDLRKVAGALNDIARLCEAVRYTAGLGKSQWERVEAARKIAHDAVSRLDASVSASQKETV